MLQDQTSPTHMLSSIEGWTNSP
uniref:Uncharacterized protein n=1 Tax=Rhizophora mucronata TaxID=61149 RepID=A0A2P2Q6H6_RHIMU